MKSPKNHQDGILGESWGFYWISFENCTLCTQLRNDHIEISSLPQAIDNSDISEKTVFWCP